VADRKRILKRSFSHTFNSRRLTSNYGVKTLSVKIPSGWKYDKHVLRKSTVSGVGTSVRIKSAPRKGQTGNKKISIGWRVGVTPGIRPKAGKLRYSVEVLVYKTTTPTRRVPTRRVSVRPAVINLGSRNWQRNAMKVMAEGKRPLSIKINPKSKTGKIIINIIKRLVKQGKLKFKYYHNSPWAAVAIVGLLMVGHIVTVLGAYAAFELTVLSALMAYAIYNRCNVNDFTFNTNVDSSVAPTPNQVPLTVKSITGITMTISGCRGPARR